ncbi:MAG: sugar O-acetyltransferase [Odoribacter sp.]|nr:sugar O-acetyltransferase [Odoribacter sp.]
MNEIEIWAEMLSGKPYDATHPHLINKLESTREVIARYNSLQPNDFASREALLRKLLGHVGSNPVVHQPFRCDYGENISFGDNVFVNFGLTVLDEAKVTIGSNVFIGPNVSIYTACHPLEAGERRRGIEWAEPVTIGNDVWIGGNAVILPGVTIGDGCVIGAGAVVTRSVDPYTLAAGNPARPIRKVSE